MRVTTLIAAAAAVLSLGASAQAANLVTNGSFEQDSLGTSHEFGASIFYGQTVTGWTSAASNAFNLYMLPSQATGPTDIPTRFGEHGQFLWQLPAGDPDGGNFVALDGDTQYNGALTQTIGGLVVGQTYDLTFDWATAQYADRQGVTTEKLVVDFGGQEVVTDTVVNPSEGSTPWRIEHFKFTATSVSQVLSFLSIGTPNGQPPVALLDGVSLTQAVPEPATWAMMIAGFGLVGGLARRRRAAVLAA
jgi:hypothetical protein